MNQSNNVNQSNKVDQSHFIDNTKDPEFQKPKDDEEDKMISNLMDAIVSERPNVKWDDIAGLENAKKTLHEAVTLPIKFPQIF